MNCFNCSPLGSDRLCRSCSIERWNLSVFAAVIAFVAVCVLVQMGNGGSPPEMEDDQAFAESTIVAFQSKRVAFVICTTANCGIAARYLHERWNGG